MQGNNLTLDLQGKTYRVDSTLVIDAGDMTISNGTIDFSNALFDDTCIRCNGTQDAAILLTADANISDTTLTLADTSGLLPGDYLFLESNSIWATYSSGASNATISEWVQIESVNGPTEVGIFQPLALAYTVAEGGRVSRVNFLENIALRNVFLLGADTEGFDQVGVDGTSVRNFQVEGGGAQGFDRIAYEMTRSLDCWFYGGVRCSSANGVGVGYGIGATQGTQNLSVIHCYGEDLQHFVTSGGTSGIVRGLQAHNCEARACRRAAFESHPGTVDVDFSYNRVWMAAASNRQAIAPDGASAKVVGNIIYNAQGFGIQCQPAVNAAYEKFVELQITGNTVLTSANTEPILIFKTDVTAPGGTLSDISVLGNICRGGDNAFTVITGGGAPATDIERLRYDNNHFLNGISVIVGTTDPSEGTNWDGTAWTG